MYFEKLVQKYSLSAPEHPLFNLIVELAQEVVRVVETTGRVLTQSLASPELVTVRGEQARRTVVRVRHNLGSYVLTFTFQPLSGEAANVEVLSRDVRNGEPVTGTTVRLESEKTKLCNTTDPLGKASFTNLRPGNYQVFLEVGDAAQQPIVLEIRTVAQ